MKIIFSNYDDLKNPYYAGGGAVAIHEVAKRLSLNGRVMVITGNYPGANDYTLDNVIYKRIGIKSGGPKLGQIIYQLLLPYYILTCKFDVWVENFTPPFSTGMLQLFTKKKIIGLVHMLSGKDMERKYKLPFSKVEGLGLKTYRHFIVTSPEIKKSIRKYNKHARIEIIPNGVEVSGVSGGNGKYILYLGRIEVNQKGLDLLVEGFAGMQKQAGIKLVIAGSGERKQIDILEKLIQKFKIGESVRLTGKVIGKKKQILLSNALCVVVPSRFETFSITSLEAMANGIPLITFDIKGLKWIGKGARMTIKPFDTNKLSESLLTLVKDRKLRKSLSIEGRKFAGKFSWEKTADVYRKVVGL